MFCFSSVSQNPTYAFRMKGDASPFAYEFFLRAGQEDTSSSLPQTQAELLRFLSSTPASPMASLSPVWDWGQGLTHHHGVHHLGSVAGRVMIYVGLGDLPCASVGSGAPRGISKVGDRRGESSKPQEHVSAASRKCGCSSSPGVAVGWLLARVLGSTNCLGLSHKKLVQGGHTWGRGGMEIEFGGQVWERWEGTFAREALCPEALCHPSSCFSGSSQCEEAWASGSAE